MLNVDYITKLYKSMSREDKKDFLFKVFGPGRQSMAYFKRTKDTTLSKAELMARLFDIPVDALLTDSPYTYNRQTKSISRFGCTEVESPSESIPSPASDVCQKKIEELEKEIRYLKEISELKDDKLKLLEEKLASKD